MRLGRVSTLFALLAVLFPSAAAADTIQTWRVSITGTSTSTAIVTNRECGDNYDAPATGRATETAQMRTTKASLVNVFHEGKTPVVTLDSDMKPIWLAGSITRTSELAAPDTPVDCHGSATPPNCGTRTFVARGAVAGPAGPGRKAHGVALELDQDGYFHVSGDAFQDCPLGDGQSDIPYFAMPGDASSGSNPIAMVPQKKLFARHRRTFTVHAKSARSGQTDGGPDLSDWSYSFDFALKFVPVR